MRECLIQIPQYDQVYPAPRSDVSISLEQMIAQGFPRNQSIVWLKPIHSEKRYYWIMKANGKDEVRVKVNSRGISSKAGKYQRLDLSR